MGFFLMLAIVFVYWFILNKTTFGFEIKAVGHSPFAAQYAGVKTKSRTISTMVIAGAFAGLAGAIVGVQRAMNGQINEHSHQSFTTSFLNFIMGTTFLVIFLAILVLINSEELVPLPAGPWWIYTGGVIGVIYIAFTSTIVQHLGVLTFTLFSVGGQLVGSLLIDLYSPTDGVHVSIYLVTGIAMTYLGVIVGGVNNSQSRKRLTHK